MKFTKKVLKVYVAQDLHLRYHLRVCLVYIYTLLYSLVKSAISLWLLTGGLEPLRFLICYQRLLLQISTLLFSLTLPFCFTNSRINRKLSIPPLHILIKVAPAKVDFNLLYDTTLDFDCQIGKISFLFLRYIVLRFLNMSIWYLFESTMS